MNIGYIFLLSKLFILNMNNLFFFNNPILSNPFKPEGSILI